MLQLEHNWSISSYSEHVKKKNRRCVMIESEDSYRASSTKNDLSQGGSGCGHHNHLPGCFMDLVPGMHYHLQDREKDSCGRRRNQECRVLYALPVHPWRHRVSLPSAGRKVDSLWHPAALGSSCSLCATGISRSLEPVKRNCRDITSASGTASGLFPPVTHG